MAFNEGDGATGLGDVPEACISAILSCMQSAQDVLRASSVSSTFAAAASSDVVWQALLPAGSEEAIEHALWDRPSPYDSVPTSSSQPLQQPAVHQIMGHLMAGVHAGGVPGGRGRFRGRPLLLVPNPLSAAGRRDADGGIVVNGQSANETNSAGQNDVIDTGAFVDSVAEGAEGQDAIAAGPPGPPESPKELFQRLAQGVLLGEAGSESYRADVSTGGVERMFSALGAHITWGSDTRYWQRAPEHGSFFGASMYLKSVCWLEVSIDSAKRIASSRWEFPSGLIDNAEKSISLFSQGSNDPRMLTRCTGTLRLNLAEYGKICNSKDLAAICIPAGPTNAKSSLPRRPHNPHLPILPRSVFSGA